MNIATRIPDLRQRERRSRTMRLIHHFSQTTEEDVELREVLLSLLIGHIGRNVYIQPPFYCEYGDAITLTEGAFINFGYTILDLETAHIGANTRIAPSVQIYTVGHALDPSARTADAWAPSAPVTIGENVWIGGAAIICPGVSIGDHTTFGAGSVVTKDLHARVVAAGNPCRVIRHL